MDAQRQRHTTKWPLKKKQTLAILCNFSKWQIAVPLCLLHIQHSRTSHVDQIHKHSRSRRRFENFMSSNAFSGSTRIGKEPMPQARVKSVTFNRKIQRKTLIWCRSIFRYASNSFVRSQFSLLIKFRIQIYGHFHCLRWCFERIFFSIFVFLREKSRQTSQTHERDAYINIYFHWQWNVSSFSLSLPS